MPLTLDAVMKQINSQFAKTFDRIDIINSKLDTVKAELDEKLDAVSRDFLSFKKECADKFKLADEALCAFESRIDGITQEIGGVENLNELSSRRKPGIVLQIDVEARRPRRKPSPLGGR